MLITFKAENAPHLKMSEQLQIHLVSLYRFRELEIERGEDLNNWMHFFASDYADPEKVKELMEMTEEMRGMEQTYRRVVNDPEVQRQYDYERLLREDYLMRVHEFRADGKAEGKVEVAKKLLNMGLSVETVAEGTGLSLSEIKKLQKE